MQIRHFTDADRPALADLQLASWRAAYAPFVSAEALGDALEEQIITRWQDIEIGDQEFVLVAQDEGALQGFVTLLAQEMPFIDNFHVRPGLYRSGIGRALMRETAKELLALGQSKVALTVLEDNTRARSFYAALGGETVEIFDRAFLDAEKVVHRIEWHDLPTLTKG